MTENLLPRDHDGQPIDKELVDDLADVLAKTVVGWESIIGRDLAQAPEVQRVMARYRRAVAAGVVATGDNHE